MTSTTANSAWRRDQRRESALTNVEQIKAYADLVFSRLATGQPIGPVQVQSILRNAEELLAAVAVIEELDAIAEAAVSDLGTNRDLTEHRGMGICNKSRKHPGPCDYGSGV
jgi:hypothetical protein